MNKSCLGTFIIVLPLILGSFCVSCTQKLVKTETTPSYVDKPSEYVSDIENLTREAFKLYYQSKFEEAIRKLESSQSMISNDTSKSTIISLYILLAFFQEKSSDVEFQRKSPGSSKTIPQSVSKQFPS